jgi:hypothetical protein
MPKLTKFSFLLIPLYSSTGHYLLHFHFFLRIDLVYMFIFSLCLNFSDKIQDWVLPHQNKEKVYINICV